MSIGEGRASQSAAESRAASAPASLSAAYAVGEFFVVRTPLLAMHRLVRWGERRRDPNPAQPTLGWDERLTELNNGLLAELAEPALSAALLLASPDAHALSATPAAPQPLAAKALRTLTRYFLRASSRDTPFGLFAGVSLGRVGVQDCLRLAGAEQYRANTRIALSCLRDLMQQLAVRPEAREKQAYEVNSTLALVHGDYRMVAVVPREASAAADKSVVLSIESSTELSAVLALAREGASLPRLCELLQRRGYSEAQVRPFIEELRARGVLVPSAIPSATGTGALASAIQELNRVELHAEAQALAALSSELALAAAAPLQEQTQRLGQARACLTKLESGSTVQSLQTDLVKPAPELVLGKTTAQLLLAAADVVQRTGRVVVDPELADFCKRFTARYEARLVPLAEATDRDLGVGFGKIDVYPNDQLIADLPLRQATQASVVFDKLDRARQRLWQRSVARGDTVCELDDEALEQLSSAEPNARFPESFGVMARLSRQPDGRLLVVAPAVVSVVGLLGRFGEADPALAAALERCAAHEQALAGDVVLADVAYLPHDKSANIVGRPSLRTYEIPYLGGSSAPQERQLAIDDLWVGVERGRAQLYSRRLQKRVSIRLGNAHNFDAPGCPSVYRFLGALQRQDTALTIGWSWGVLEDAEFLPRVTCGSTVLSLARWRLPLGKLRAGSAQVQPGAFAAVQRMRSELHLPRLLTRSEGDQRMVVDLDNELSVDELLHYAQDKDSVALEELLPGPEELAVHGPEGGFAAELIVPFLKKQPVRGAQAPRALERLTVHVASAGRHVPGSDWLYAKVYCPRSLHGSVVRLLREQVIGPALGAAVTRWFYLPFADPEPHVRVRLQGESSALRGEVLTRLEQALRPLLARGSVGRWELSTYEQELERYGGPQHIELAERVFCADSEATATLLGLCRSAGDALRWQLVLVGIDRLFADAGLSESQRAELVGALSEGYAEEFGASVATRKALGTKYRSYSARLTQMLWHEPEARDVKLREATRAWARRSEELRPTWHEYRRRESAGELFPALPELCASFAHLHAIRLLGISARAHELVLFDFLKRQYTARAKHPTRDGVLAS